MNNESEEMIEYISNNYNLSKKQSISLLINIVSNIFDEDKELINKHVNQIK